ASIAAHLKVRKFVIDAAVDPQRGRKIFSDVDEKLPALLADGRIGNGKGNSHLLAVLVDREEVDLVVELIVGGLATSLEREAPQVRPRPTDTADRLVLPRVHGLLEAAVHRRAVFDQSIALDV